MNYSKELCQLIINNMEIIETAPAIIDEVEANFLKAMNVKIKEWVKLQANWNGVFDFYGEDDDLWFAPNSWITDMENSDAKAWFYIYPDEESGYWLSSAIGVLDTNFFFMLEFDASKLDREQKKILKESIRKWYNENPQLQDYGFTLKNYQLLLPFTFDKSVLSAEYPDFDEVFEPLDEMLNKMLEFMPAFDSFVKQI